MILGAIGAKFVKEFVAEYAMIKLINAVEDKLTMRAVKGKTPDQIVKELCEEIENAKKEELKNIEKGAKQELTERHGVEFAEKIKMLTMRYVEAWANVLNKRIDDAGVAMVALKDSYKNDKRFEKYFGEIVSDLKGDMKESIKFCAKRVESIYRYELIMDFIKENSHQVVVDGETYLMPDDIIYASKGFQLMAHYIERSEKFSSNQSIVNRASLKSITISTLSIYEQTECKLRKHESKEQTEKRFAKIVKEARAAAEKLKEE